MPLAPCSHFGKPAKNQITYEGIPLFEKFIRLLRGNITKVFPQTNAFMMFPHRKKLKENKIFVMFFEKNFLMYSFLEFGSSDGPRFFHPMSSP